MRSTLHKSFPINLFRNLPISLNSYSTLIKIKKGPFEAPVGTSGIEPPTQGFSVLCSTN